MTDRPLPPAPPPPAPPAPAQSQPPQPPLPPGEKAPPAPSAIDDTIAAQPPAEELTSHVAAVLAVPGAVQPHEMTEDAQRSIPAEIVPTIPPFDSIVGMIKEVCIADGIPEGEFARDFPIPVEARLRLIANSAEKLTGRRPPADIDLSNMAAKCKTVGALIDLFEGQHPDHPLS